MAEPAKNTPAQVAAHKAAEDRWATEKELPLWEVVLTGEPTVWVPRKDERYWQPHDPNDPDSKWVPKPAKELPLDAELDDDNNVVRTARGTVTVRARNADHAKALALSANPDYHTVESAKQIK